MKTALIMSFVPALLIISSSGSYAVENRSAASWTYGDSADSIGYSSVNEALEDLKKKPGTEVRDQNGWTVINQQGAKEMVLWSFAPSTHPAHPAVARRGVFEKDGGIYVDLKVLCEASKRACDNFVAEFKKLNEQMTQGFQAEAPQAPARQEKWAPDEKQVKAANDLAQQYLKLRDGGHYQEAYALLAPGMQKLMSFKEWSRHSEEFRQESGGDPVHEVTALSWHKDPPGAAYPGVYAAFDLNCRYRNIDLCTETLILHQQETGEFRVMRHEQNIVDKEAEHKLPENSKNAL